MNKLERDPLRDVEPDILPRVRVTKQNDRTLWSEETLNLGQFALLPLEVRVWVKKLLE